jgi:hypothetical protein
MVSKINTNQVTLCANFRATRDKVLIPRNEFSILDYRKCKPKMY